MGERMQGGVLPGTVDLVILRTVADGPVHGFAISKRLLLRSGGVVHLQDAALYQALHRLARKGLLETEWALTDSNRRAKFYRLTDSGRDQLELEESSFRSYVEGVFRILEPEPVGA